MRKIAKFYYKFYDYRTQIFEKPAMHNMAGSFVNNIDNIMIPVSIFADSLFIELCNYINLTNDLL